MVLCEVSSCQDDNQATDFTSLQQNPIEQILTNPGLELKIAAISYKFTFFKKFPVSINFITPI